MLVRIMPCGGQSRLPGLMGIIRAIQNQNPCLDPNQARPISSFNRQRIRTNISYDLLHRLSQHLAAAAITKFQLPLFQFRRSAHQNQISPLTDSSFPRECDIQPHLLDGIKIRRRAIERYPVCSDQRGNLKDIGRQGFLGPHQIIGSNPQVSSHRDRTNGRIRRIMKNMILGGHRPVSQNKPLGIPQSHGFGVLLQKTVKILFFLKSLGSGTLMIFALPGQLHSSFAAGILDPDNISRAFCFLIHNNFMIIAAFDPAEMPPGGINKLINTFLGRFGIRKPADPISKNLRLDMVNQLSIHPLKCSTQGTFGQILFC